MTTDPHIGWRKILLVILILPVLLAFALFAWSLLCLFFSRDDDEHY